MYGSDHPVIDWIKLNGNKLVYGALLLMAGYFVAGIQQPKNTSPVPSGFTKKDALGFEADISLLRDPNSLPESRIAAVGRLRKNQEHLNADTLLDILLAEPDNEVGEVIASLLRPMPEHSTAVLRYIRERKPRGNVRIRMSQLFKGTSRPEELDILRKFTYDPNSDVRLAAYQALAKSNSPRAARLLGIRLPKEDSKVLRNAILDGLERIGHNREASAEILGN